MNKVEERINRRNKDKENLKIAQSEERRLDGLLRKTIEHQNLKQSRITLYRMELEYSRSKDLRRIISGFVFVEREVEGLSGVGKKSLDIMAIMIGDGVFFTLDNLLEKKAISKTLYSDIMLGIVKTDILNRLNFCSL